ncbi:MarR family winged helix-turn-helix transcriptional regulator [Luteococcus peritonei]|uniref:MarR family winged helix-turn-helix transcriptional regulator n=1 Tax=Luteococcus peritonei TaxID=88874 RepID=A0ABW4S046_9ACTN
MHDFREFGFLVNLVARQLERRMAEALRPLGLTPAYLPVMISLAQVQPQTQTGLAVALDIRQPTMAQTLGRMERDGLITRAPDSHDRRATSITLTDKAEGLLGAIQDLGSEILTDALADLPEQRRTELAEDLHTVSRRLSGAEEA